MKSMVVAPAASPVDLPVPRSSYLSEAIPLRASLSARTRNGLCPNSSSSRFCKPLPLTITTTGTGFFPS